MKYFDFGFEYECLIEIKSAYFQHILDKLISNKLKLDFDDYSRNSSHNSLSTNGSNTSDREFWRIVRNDDIVLNRNSRRISRMNRFFLASIFNTMDENIQFLATPNYNDEPIYVKPLLPYKITTNKKKQSFFWTITSDNSVQKEMCEPPFYQNHKELSDYKYNINNCPNNIIEFIEIVSPIISWKNICCSQDNIIMKTLNEIINCNDIFDYWHNKRTSAHVHISRGVSFMNEKNIVKICMAWWYFEPIILTFVEKWRRTTEYAKHMNDLIVPMSDENKQFLFRDLNETNYKKIFNRLQIKYPSEKELSWLEKIIFVFQSFNKYSALNLLNINKINTVEIRIKEGTTNLDNIVLFMKFFAYFLDASCRKPCITKLTSESSKTYFWDVKTKTLRKQEYDLLWQELYSFLDRRDFYEKDCKNIYNYWKNISGN